MTRRSIAVLACAVVVGACGPSVSTREAADVLRSSPSFKGAKLAYLPRVIAIPADGLGSGASSREGEAVTLEELAGVDPVIAVLRARAAVEIEDFVSASYAVRPPRPATLPPIAAPAPHSTDSVATGPSAADSAALRRAHSDSSGAGELTPHNSPPPIPSVTQSWTHTLRVTPTQRLELAQLTSDDGDDHPDSPRPVYGGTHIARTPGWTLAIGTRELVKVLDVSSRDKVRDSVPGDVAVEFSWRWRPTAAGALFDAESAEFQSLPRAVQDAAQRGDLRLESGLRWSRAILARTSTGWRVTHVDWNFGDGRTPPT